jgi:hypothetical protein
MSYQTAQRFLHNYGQDKLFWLRVVMNDEDFLQEAIAKELKLSEARVSQMCAKLGKWKWDFRQPTIDALEFELSVRKRDAALIREAIRDYNQNLASEDPRLRLIRGGSLDKG